MVYFLILPIFFLITPVALGQEALDESSTIGNTGTDSVNSPTEETVFDTKLPETQDRGVLEISLSPRFADTIDKEWIRYRTRLKYGLSENLESSVTLDFFSDNPFRSNGTSGLSEWTVWTKYRFDPWPTFPSLRASAGIDLTFPIGNPPSVLSDQYFHIKPYLVFSRFFPGIRNLEGFTNLGFDLTSNPPLRKKPDQERPDHFLGVSIGGIYDVWENMRHSLDFSYRTTEIGGGNKNAIFFDSGLHWQIPYSFFGTWQLGGGIRIPLTDPGNEIEFFTRVKWDIDLKLRVRLKNGELI